ncbi:hypothetical protein [Carnobacterium divergens]|uniref:hypothetical protein n=1 Tax=Carnobacterium divergens TaxID=2748 RepID=UPI001431EC21|nr:hypothetical protein [Carnobacterium divergens]
MQQSNNISVVVEIQNINELKKSLSEAVSLTEQLTGKLSEIESFVPDIKIPFS